jgi:hypothetical protein
MAPCAYAGLAERDFISPGASDVTDDVVRATVRPHAGPTDKIHYVARTTP